MNDRLWPKKDGKDQATETPSGQQRDLRRISAQETLREEDGGRQHEQGNNPEAIDREQWLKQMAEVKEPDVIKRIEHAYTSRKMAHAPAGTRTILLRETTGYDVEAVRAWMKRNDLKGTIDYLPSGSVSLALGATHEQMVRAFKEAKTGGKYTFLGEEVAAFRENPTHDTLQKLGDTFFDKNTATPRHCQDLARVLVEDRRRLRDVLIDTVNDPKKLAEVAARSYHHQLSFDRIVLTEHEYTLGAGEVAYGNLYLHLYRSGTIPDGAGEQNHFHGFDMASAVLTGSITDMRFYPTDFRPNDSGIVPGMTVFRADGAKPVKKSYVLTSYSDEFARGPDTLVFDKKGYLIGMQPSKQFIGMREEKVGEVFFQSAGTRVYNAGSTYSMTFLDGHRARGGAERQVSETRPLLQDTSTLYVGGPIRRDQAGRDISLQLREGEEPPPDRDVPLAPHYTPDELRPVLINYIIDLTKEIEQDAFLEKTGLMLGRQVAATLSVKMETDILFDRAQEAQLEAKVSALQSDLFHLSSPHLNTKKDVDEGGRSDDDLTERLLLHKIGIYYDDPRECNLEVELHNYRAFLAQNQEKMLQYVAPKVEECLVKIGGVPPVEPDRLRLPLNGVDPGEPTQMYPFYRNYPAGTSTE